MGKKKSLPSEAAALHRPQRSPGLSPGTAGLQGQVAADCGEGLRTLHLPRSWEPQDLPSAPKQGPKVLSAYSHTAEAGCQGQDVLPQAQLVANCEKVKPSQTHRGPHRRGVTTSRGRATHCDQRHRAGPGHLGEHPARPLPQPTVSPRLRTTRKERLELLGPGTSSGAALKGPDSRPVGSHRAGTERWRPLPSALGSARPAPSSPEAWWKAGPRAGRR